MNPLDIDIACEYWCKKSKFSSFKQCWYLEIKEYKKALEDNQKRNQNNKGGLPDTLGLSGEKLSIFKGLS